MISTIIDLLIFSIYSMIIFSKFNIPSDMISKTMLIIIIIIILFRNWMLGLGAAIMFIVKDYVPKVKEGFKQKKTIKLHKDLINVDNSLRPKDSNSVFFMKQSQSHDIKPFNF
jgi:hypothetical protein